MHKNYLQSITKSVGYFGSCARCAGLYQDVFGQKENIGAQLSNCATSCVSLWMGIPIFFKGQRVSIWSSGYGSGYDLMGFAIQTSFAPCTVLPVEPTLYEQFKKMPLCDLCIKKGLSCGSCHWIFEYNALDHLSDQSNPYKHLLEVGYAFEQECKSFWSQHDTYSSRTEASKKDYWYPFAGSETRLEYWSLRASQILAQCQEQMKKEIKKQIQYQKREIKKIIALPK